MRKQMRSRYRVKRANTYGKEVHFLRVNARKYIHIYTREGRSCLLHRVIGQQREQNLSLRHPISIGE